MEISAELLALDSTGFSVALQEHYDRAFHRVAVETSCKAETEEYIRVSAEETCWICLAEATTQESLIQPCSCPKKVHQSCLAQWQMVQCGRSEEVECRFCQNDLPDWKAALADKPKAAPLMTVSHNGQVHVLKVEAGETGRSIFEHRIREIFGLTDEAILQENISVTFGIKEPFAGNDLTLDGWSAWSAAVVCASCSAASRPATLPLKDLSTEEETQLELGGARTARSSSLLSRSLRQAIYDCLQSWWPR